MNPTETGQEAIVPEASTDSLPPASVAPDAHVSDIIGKTVRDTLPQQHWDGVPQKILDAYWRQPKLGAFLKLWRDNGDVTQLMEGMLADAEGNPVTSQAEIEDLGILAGMVMVNTARKLESDIMQVTKDIRAEVATEQGKKT